MSHAIGKLAVSALLLLLIAPARALADGPAPASEQPEADSAAAPEMPPAPPPKRFVAHLNVGLVAYNWVGASGAMPSGGASLADRQTLVQLAGLGYFVRPNLRLMLSLQLAETIGGGKPGQSAFALGGVIPWVAWHPIAPLFLGVGVLLAARSYAQWKFDAGVFTCIGAVWPVGGGFAVGAAVQVPITFVVRPAVSVVPALFVAYRF